jgi:cyclic beta-1,2-glucan synthetase
MLKSAILRALGRGLQAAPWNNEESIREELFSIERLEQHAESLAAAQPVSARPTAGRSLAARLKDNEAVLLEAYRAIANAVGEGRAITPAAEWLLDNYHLVEEQIREIRDDLPPGYYRQLPKLTAGPFAGYPQVFAVAWAFVAHTDSRFDPEMLRRFLRAYQRVRPLTIGELWAVAITLRIVLVENLRRGARRIVTSRAAREEADALADRLLGVNSKAAEPLDSVFQQHGEAPLLSAFAVQLVQRLRDQDPKVTPALRWLEQRLAAQGTTGEQIVHDEHQSQGATNVTVRNIITSMRLISDVDWAELFESVSLADEALRAGSDFADMDFPTRNLYRSAIEELARGSRLTELEIARAALAAAGDRGVLDGDAASRSRDPGYHLVAGGRRDFERAVGFRPPWRGWPGRFNAAIGIRGYIAAATVLAALILAWPLYTLAEAGIDGRWLALLAVLGLVPAMDAAIAVVNRGLTRGLGATILPGLELRAGVPARCRTVVAVPVLLTTLAAIEEHIQQLEIHHLAGTDGELYFALLSDWTDAETESVAGDGALLDAAAAGIARLNRLYGPAAAGDRFLLLHRRRVWSEGQRRWIGWERKRGKLHELNRWLRGAADTTFIGPRGANTGPLPAPPAVRYVITLDADTRMPRDTARRLVGKMAHALNRPRFDAGARRVVEGYGVLQPRVAPSLPVGREGSLFQRIFSSASGIDPYAAAVSDVYQDLCGEGSYTGKGIYDVDAFEAALDRRVPEGTLLSHDLFEGTYARAGLASDIEVVEEFPSRYDVASARQHRWARGDWQLLPWLLGRAGRRELPLIGRWKMLDNLRRSLSAPAGVAALLAGWTLPLHGALIWTGFIVSTIALSTLVPVLAAIVPRRARITARSHLYALASDAILALSLTALMVVFLAHQAWLMADAIVRTLYRLTASRRHLLDWVTAGQAMVSPRLDLPGFYHQMIGGVAIGLAAALAVWLSGGDAWPAAATFVAAWIASPAIALWASRSPLVAGRLPVEEPDARSLRLVARRTWRYFETFVTAADHSLPPDNFQEDPSPTIAHRTSPTNLGLYLLAAVSARDFGWAGIGDTVDRLEATLATMGGMERFRGHFYNWYDSRNLRPLDPQYVSSVDSGNLAGHLITLANACRQWIVRPVAGSEAITGVEDALALTRETVLELPDDRRTQTITRHQLGEALDDLAAALRPEPSRRPASAEEIAARLAKAGSAAVTMVDIARTLAGERGDAAGAEMLFWAEATLATLESHRRDLARTAAATASLEARLGALAEAARAFAGAMDFAFLLDPDRKLLSIGYRVAEGNLDPSCYDLLASEARLASFVAIAKGDVPARHWFRLGRAVTPVGTGAALISWSGSMFEYLMPSLIMRAPAGSLLEQTSRLIVRRQIAHGAALGTPWGISESAYNVRDLELTYQYSNFGVPGLGLKRGLSENAVVAPYATALAAMVDPEAGARNFAALAAVGARGRYGYYEALDYTRARLPEGKDVAVVRAYMAHHQGMTVIGIANALLDGAMRARFHAEPMVQATELLLQERTPRDVAVAHPRAEEVRTAGTIRDLDLPAVRRFRSAHAATPDAHLFSNGRYTVMLTAAGSGYSRWRGLGITRWREDVTRDDWGSYIFLRDVESGEVWSAGHQPTGVEAHSYEVTFTEDRAEFVRRDGPVTTVLEVVVSPEDDAEVRRVCVTNADDSPREVEVTSYAELVLAAPAADTAHPAFSKLFVQTEYLPKIGVILATRRRRSPDEPEVWAAHMVVVEGDCVGEPEIETDRARFLGRGREVRTPMAVVDGLPLSNTVGAVLDPVFALRRRVRIAPGRSARLSFWTVVASSRSAVLDLADKHHDATAFDRAATLAWTRGQVQLSHLGIDADQASQFQQLAGAMLHADPAMRPSSDAIRRGGGRPAALWAQGISGDLPIVLVRIDNIDDMALVRQLLRAHEYWRSKQLAVDLVILNERASSYVQDLQVALETLVRTSQSRPRTGTDVAQGAVFVLRSDLVPAETRALLLAMARAVLAARNGTLSEQLQRLKEADGAAAPPAGAPPRKQPRATMPTSTPAPPDLEFFNGFGGFAAGGSEYVTVLGPGRWLPAPWINVVANPSFGFQASVEGSGYTWSEGSRENQLTPWSNDPVTDRPGEVLYVRDEESGEVWGPTAMPVRSEAAPYTARHGQGYSRFEHAAHGIALDLVQYVPLADPVKISRLTLRNLSGRSRRLSVTAYVEWVLGPSRAASAHSVVTDIDPETGAMLARNPWNIGFGARVAFADLAGRQTAWTGDRREFLGRNGTLDNPAGLAHKAVLSQRVGAGLDPCGALQAMVELKPGATAEVVFFLGQAASAPAARALVARYRAADLDECLREVTGHWDGVLGAVQVKTPDRAMDVMLNRWLLYQTLACRVWARAAFYQASGAYGFRDQLQDGMALVLSRPDLARAHLLRAAARQFVAGDVQHWWLPHSGQGVRTRISDDRVWLAYAAAHYVDATGDSAVLEERVPFLEGQVLRAGEHDAYFQPVLADENATLYEHCARGLDGSLAVGKHGLPLIGTGDWNDGMNRVGELGRGESAWLGWFLHATLTKFASLAQLRGDAARAAPWKAHAAALRNALEQDAWDGGWYRRGYFDDGTPLGSSASGECRIDSIAQSWSVISGAGDPARAARAMAAVDEQLILREERLALLFTPPFDRTPLDPGYIKGYPPGIRENGGQYTHAASWSVIAFAGLFSLLNPINHAKTRADVQRYKVEPYVVAADIYSVAPHAGRGGWTWYTGSAGWLYRAGLEAILGFSVQGAFLRLAPCIPREWPGFEIVYRYRSARYEIAVENPRGVNRGVSSIELDGQLLPAGAARIPLEDDGRTHKVRAVLG